MGEGQSVNRVEHDGLLAAAVKALDTPELPRRFAALAGQLAAFDNLIIIAYSGEQRPRVLYREYTDPVVYLPMDTQYLEAAYLLDPFYHEHRKGNTRGIRRLSEVAPDHFRRTRYYNRYYKQTTLLDEVAVFARVTDNITLTACLGRDRSSGTPFARRELQALHRHEQTLSALLEQHWRDYRSDDAAGRPPVPLEERLRRIVHHEHGIHLSPRQAEVALLILRGYSSRSIGMHLDISRETVKVFRRQLYARCHLSSQAELFALLMPLLAGLSEHE